MTTVGRLDADQPPDAGVEAAGGRLHRRPERQVVPPDVDAANRDAHDAPPPPVSHAPTANKAA
jgi:hypothetical protein